LFSGICAAATWLIFNAIDRPFIWPYAVALGWFTIISLILLTWQDRSQGPNIQPFIRRFMGGMLIKLLVSLILLFVLVKSVSKEIVSPMASTFLLLYLAYLGFSTVWLVKRIRGIHHP